MSSVIDAAVLEIVFWSVRSHDDMHLLLIVFTFIFFLIVLITISLIVLIWLYCLCSTLSETTIPLKSTSCSWVKPDDEDEELDKKQESPLGPWQQNDWGILISQIPHITCLAIYTSQYLLSESTTDLTSLHTQWTTQFKHPHQSQLCEIVVESALADEAQQYPDFEDNGGDLSPNINITFLSALWY
ncbi:hypothetical protein FB45DRAFT_1002827 [Roridomyces roridus]|uniref:Uncharacterized protein n=1 Tax=Roridomyces roridus TaxID=1738132 RepID=A0AAD7BWD4_9AGAR|nr:hypothetical protein FB45DRAFT_1002827 [Roridomyces roridus]